MTDEQHPRRAEGQSSSSQDDLAPRGEDLASGRLPGTGPYVVDDEEAEELQNSSDIPDSTPDRGDPQDVVIDDAEQLADAEQAARRAHSSRPRRKAARAAGEESAKDATAVATRDAEGHGDAEAAHVPRREITRAPVRREKVVEETGAQEHKRANPVKFTKQSVDELKKVKWPSGQEAGQYFVVVLIFVLLIIAVVGGLDAFFAWGLLKTLG